MEHGNREKTEEEKNLHGRRKVGKHAGRKGPILTSAPVPWVRRSGSPHLFFPRYRAARTEERRLRAEDSIAADDELSAHYIR
jgi:hypothetical protein